MKQKYCTTCGCDPCDCSWGTDQIKPIYQGKTNAYYQNTSARGVQNKRHAQENTIDFRQVWHIESDSRYHLK